MFVLRTTDQYVAVEIDLLVLEKLWKQCFPSLRNELPDTTRYVNVSKRSCQTCWMIRPRRAEHSLMPSVNPVVSVIPPTDLHGHLCPCKI